MTRQHEFTDRLHLVKPVKSVFPLSLCVCVRVILRTRRWHEDARFAEAHRQADGETDRQTGPDVTALGWGSVRVLRAERT